ncbi:MAG: carboxypeptidase-like regulatory domain-containing protein, partial [Acidobacteriales bacterium]|nr:carboxypeptidase-like regulatory domain-containing protein [Terriglobales bacterium]
MFRLAAILFCFLPLLAEEQPPSKIETDKAALASVSGMVVRADTGEPLKKAKVYLGSNEAETNYEERTDAEGRFLISNVQPGRYGIWAVAQGYLGSSYGAKAAGRRVPMLVLEKGQRVQDLLFRLQRTAAITG